MKQKEQKSQVTGKEIIAMQKKLKKQGMTVNDALLFLFKEMIDAKSQSIQMQMNNDKGEEIQLTVSLEGVGIESDEHPKPRVHSKYEVPTVS